ncbi:MAG: glycosyltransferase family 4 protein [Flavobacteriaceae bacterium]|uniref:glycosyltransferase family 4 protein n=1 Tax=Marivivens aquimaris TaxID=2774876 RepID=UPI00178EB674|nr:glycosyltransferase family 4 protein [Marivivens aquimaris]NVJ64183.1 glycosyltransferase family 4 protein [Flavobacteriaceae bacterium]
MKSDRITVVAEYHDAPAEGINVVSKTLIDDLRAAGHDVSVVSPWRLLRSLPQLILDRAALTVFTHGPGPRTVLATRLLRLMSPTRLVWVATRPDLARLPGRLKGKRTAHAVICNQPRADLAEAAPDAEVIVQPIGIAPDRLTGTGVRMWPELATRNVPIAVHVGHLRATRGLDRLIETKALLGNQIEIVVVASPYFEPDPDVQERLERAGVWVERGFIPAIADVYRSADLYLFPAPPEAEGAIELPLSVIEAIACGLPIVSTPFGALPRALEAVTGVHFTKSTNFADTVAKTLSAEPREIPAGLPQHLDAHRLAERVLEILKAL